MENSDDEKDGVFSNYMPKELSLPNGAKFVDVGKGLLRHTNRIKIEEQLAIFLFIIGHNLRTRAVQELFRYSGETISRHFNNVLNAIMAISLEFFQPPGPDIPPEILEDPRFYPYFKVPEGKYYLVDSKYTNMPGFIAPYNGISCHLNEYSDGYPPQDSRELFNQRHTLLRNATDRSFGALKSRFPILMSAPPYPLQTQVKLVVAACALHNYILREKPDDLIFKMYGHDTVLQMEESLPPLEVEHPIMQAENPALDIAFDTEQLEFSSQLRDSIAGDMWDDCISDLSTM
ncbi:hypothetical protein OIU78_017132 [Salix suchowensis]|nr:hypothetical protein OIU78_017132 [Salix suchowensis]